MKLTSLMAGFVLVGTLTTALEVPLNRVNPFASQAFAQTMGKPDAMMGKPDAMMKKDAMAATNTQQKIANLMQHKGKKGSGDIMRSYFLGDLEPLSVQPGGAGMVVNLYNKANNLTIAYCSTYDVVVNVKQGRVTKFASNEVK